jgi:hypothetical protein
MLRFHNTRRGHKVKKKKELKYTKLYPDVFLGLGAGMPWHWGKFKISFLFRSYWWRCVRSEIRAMFRRAFRGYDNSMWYNMNGNLQMLYIRLLLELAEHSDSVPDFEGDPQNSILILDDTSEALNYVSNKWREHLAEIAEHFYESLVGVHEKNQYEDEYKSCFDYVEEKDLEYDSYTFKKVPTEGYTEQQMDDLKDLYYNRERVIENYKKEQFRIGMEKMLKVWDHLWD